MTSKRIMIVTVALAVASLLAGQEPARQPMAQQAPQGQTPPGQKAPMRNPIPDTFTNLQTLPKDITKQELVSIMKSFALTFEKRCSFCHAATDDLSEADFASDEKGTKKKARELLQLIQKTQKKP